MPDAVITVENLSAELPARPANRAGKPATLRTRQSACSVGAEAPTPTMGKRASMGCLCRDEHLYRKQQGKQPMPEQSNCKSFGDLSVRSAGWFGARQKSLRLIDRVPGRFDLLAQLRNLATTRRDQFSRQCALLGIHRIAPRRSSGVAAPFINGRRPQHGSRNRVFAAARRIRPINHNGCILVPPISVAASHCAYGAGRLAR
jgi:hypothetical protein